MKHTDWKGKQMTDNKIIHTLIQEELAEANKKHPLFTDLHHAYAVIKEETEELHEELVACEGLLSDMWHRIREDMGADDVLHQIQAHAIYAAQEAIQVAAMAQKAIDSKLQPQTRQSMCTKMQTIANNCEKLAGIIKSCITLEVNRVLLL